MEYDRPSHNRNYNNTNDNIYCNGADNSTMGILRRTNNREDYEREYGLEKFIRDLPWEIMEKIDGMTFNTKKQAVIAFVGASMCLLNEIKEN